MFKAERREKIKSLVYDRKQVDVASLSKLLNVTEVTIRSDLEYLEKEGFLKRLHGGAVLNEEMAGKQEINELLSGQVIAHNEGKERAARAAASLIEENDRIFLGAGETCYFIAKELLHFKKLTVLTNNLYVANILSSNVNIHLTLTGGQMMPGRFCVAGDMFNKNIEDLFLTKAFFSVTGADFVAGYTVESTQEVATIRAISARSKQVVLVMDHSKFDAISFIKLGDLDLSGTVVSDGGVPEEYVKYFEKNGISLLTAES